MSGVDKNQANKFFLPLQTISFNDRKKENAKIPTNEKDFDNFVPNMRK